MLMTYAFVFKWDFKNKECRYMSPTVKKKIIGLFRKRCLEESDVYFALLHGKNCFVQKLLA